MMRFATRCTCPAGPKRTPIELDFVMDALANGRRPRCLTIVDDFTQRGECLEIVVGPWHLGWILCTMLDTICQFRVRPRWFGPIKARNHQPSADVVAYGRGVDRSVIAAAKNDAECYIESFNGNFAMSASISLLQQPPARTEQGSRIGNVM